MTYKQIEKEFCENFSEYIKPVSIGQYDDNGVNIGFLSSHEVIKSFLKQSFIKYLKDEVERLEGEKLSEELANITSSGIPAPEKYYNMAISDQITHLQAQIKELEV